MHGLGRGLFGRRAEESVSNIYRGATEGQSTLFHRVVALAVFGVFPFLHAQTPVTFGYRDFNCGQGNHLTWGTPFILPGECPNHNSDKISTVLAFNGDRIGFMWSNQNEENRELCFLA